MNNYLNLNSKHLSSAHLLKSLICLSVVLLLVLIYHPLIYLGFAGPDDHWMLLKNDFVHPDKFNFHYFFQLFTRVNDIQYSPLNTLYYYLVYQFNGYDPYYYHVSNFVLHLFNGYLIYNLSKKILSAFEITNDENISFIVSLFWLIHPLQVETIAWISGSKILLCTFLTLISFICFLKAVKGPCQKFYLVASALAFILSCLCKEQAIITPFMFLLFQILLNLKKKNSSKFGNSLVKIFLLCEIFLAIGFAIFTAHVNKVDSTDFEPIVRYPFFQRIILSFYCLNFYISNLIVPIHLHYNYPFLVKPSELMPISFYLYPIIFILFLILILYQIRNTEDLYFYLFCIGLFFFQISLELQIIPMTRPAITADRYMYLASYGLLLPLIRFLYNIVLPMLKSRSKKRERLFCIFILFIFYFSIYSHHLVKYWSTLNLIKWYK